MSLLLAPVLGVSRAGAQPPPELADVTETLGPSVVRLTLESHVGGEGTGPARRRLTVGSAGRD